LIDYLVGAGGWQYFSVPNKLPLKAYSEVFGFVEVNSTFYKYPSNRTVEGWRRSVPPSFVFSVRVNQDLTHRLGLKPVDQAYEIFYKAKTYAQILQTPYVVLETPSSYTISGEASDFFSSLNMKGLSVVWEYRAKNTAEVTKLMQDYGIIPCVDLSAQQPGYSTEVTYSRLFGKGKHNIYQFTNTELEGIHKQAQRSNSKKTVLSFHGVRMYSDAARFQKHVSTGQFMQVTDYFGVESAQVVLQEDTVFPATKTQLIETQGWKVIDTKPNQTAHLAEYLDRVPDKNYMSLDEVVKELKLVL
jgi:uncharacterized protein YecE (DUF72 family)